MAYIFDVDYKRMKLLRTALQLFANEAAEGNGDGGYVRLTERTLKMDHGITLGTDEEDELNEEYFEEVQCMLSELEGLDV